MAGDLPVSREFDLTSPTGPKPAQSRKEPREVAAILPAAAPAPLVPPPGFLQACEAQGILFEPGDIERLGTYLALLLQANESMNLTAVRDPELAWTRHIFDSLTLLGMLSDLPDGSRVIDVGSGGGLPGLPLACGMPQLSFTLLESSGKKVAFLKRAAELLGLKNVRVVQERAEVAGQSRGPTGHREAYDAVLARAVGRLNILAELTVPLCKIGGRILLTKGAQAPEEVAEATKALHELKAVYVSTIETPTGHVVALEKSSATPRSYPRADGEPARVPIGGKEEPSKPASRSPPRGTSKSASWGPSAPESPTKAKPK